MSNSDPMKVTSVLDKDILQILAENQEDLKPEDEVVRRMRGSIMQQISKEALVTGDRDFETVRDNDGWVTKSPGLEVKVLHEEKETGALSYLIRLVAGFTMSGHDHPLDEECLILEGDLTLGDIELNAGDFHFAPHGKMHGDLSTKNGCMAFIRGAMPAVA